MLSGMLSERFPIYCPVCGVPLPWSDPPDEEDYYWDGRSVVISDVDPAAENQFTLIEAARVLDTSRKIFVAGTAGYKRDGTFRFLDANHHYHGRTRDTRPRIDSLESHWWFGSRDGLREPSFIGMHEACLDLALEAMNARRRGIERGIFLSSLGDLWDVLRLRMEGERILDTSKHYPGYLGSGYYGASGAQDEDWNPQDEDEWLHDDPIHIKDCLPYLLSKLQPVGSAKDIPDSDRIFAGRFRSLPVELQSHIVDLIDSDLPLQQTGLIPQHWWRTFLLDQRRIGYLWDLRSDIEISEERNKDDWELLVRQLAQVAIFEPDGHLGDCPAGLRNRRRIWRLLQEMRPGDYRPGNGSIGALPERFSSDTDEEYQLVADEWRAWAERRIVRLSGQTLASDEIG